jgi:hypothetical protein
MCKIRAWNSIKCTWFKSLVKALTELTINEPANWKFKKLIQGDEYDDKIWLGLDNTDSLIANYIYQDFLTQTDIRLSATGAKKVKSWKCNQSNTSLFNSAASQNFIKQYQGEYLQEPFIW